MHEGIICNHMVILDHSNTTQPFVVTSYAAL